MKVKDLDLLKCKTPAFNEDRLYITLNTMDLMCTFTSYCPVLCSCCRNETCLCRHLCFKQCTCLHKRDHSTPETMNCTSRNMTSLPYNYPISVDTIFLDDNNVGHLSAPNLHFSFVKGLFLNRSNISYIEPTAFRYLSHVKRLYLQDNNIDRVEALVFNNITTLEKLYLQNNKIGFIHPGSFEYLYDIKTIFLHGNNLRNIDLQLFHNITSLEELTLYNNSWDCGCEFGPYFKNWLLSNLHFISDIGRIYCGEEHGYEYAKSGLVSNQTRSPNEVGHAIPIVEIDFSFCIKPSKRDLIVAVSTISAVFVILSTIVVTCYANRLLLMVWVYNKYGLRFKHEDDENAEKPYDVFIANAPADERFVIEEMLPGLEDNANPYKVS